MIIVYCLHVAIIMRVTAVAIKLLFLSAVMEVYSQTVPYIRFMGTNLSKNSYIKLTQVGNAGRTSVQCHTDLTTCCNKSQGDDRGDWYFPNGTRLPFSTNSYKKIFEVREDQRIYLTRRKNPVTPEGIYRCDVETKATSNDNRETVYVGLYLNSNRGQYLCSCMYTTCVLMNAEHCGASMNVQLSCVVRYIMD